MLSFLSYFTGGTHESMMLLSLAVILSAFIMEDVAAIIVGVLVADGLIPLPLALVSLCVGIIMGDAGAYTVGYAARTHPKLDAYVNHTYIAPIKFWIERKYMLTVFSARFVPGTRIVTYVSSGFFRAPFLTFVLVDASAVIIWTSLLFFASYLFGSTTTWMGPLRYGIAAVVLLIFFFIARHNLRAYRKQKNQSEVGSSPQAE